MFRVFFSFSQWKILPEDLDTITPSGDTPTDADSSSVDSRYCSRTQGQKTNYANPHRTLLNAATNMLFPHDIQLGDTHCDASDSGGGTRMCNFARFTQGTNKISSCFGPTMFLHYCMKVQLIAESRDEVRQ
jgi:hypothetical protein